ncbi:MAG: B12-binding domain-containing radical SAM protein [Candidatus Hodarchaeota archaeon]
MKTNGKKIVITADQTLMSDYHGSIFFGFSVCLTDNLLPDFILRKTFFPTLRSHPNGSAKFATIGVRKIEAALHLGGFAGDVVVSHPNHLDKVVGSETRIVGISVVDPLGKGPATSTFVGLLGGEAYMTKSFRTLIRHPSIRKYQPKVVVGGPGTWQLLDEELMAKYNIDYLFLGEAENSIARVFKNILDRKNVPGIIYGQPTPLEKIPCIVNPTINGIVEIGRGCDRRCSFCSPTLRGFISRPIDQIMREINLNFSHGIDKVILQCEDVLRYGAKGIHINSEKVKDLFRHVCSYPGLKELQVCHVTLSSVMDEPKLLGELSDIVGVGEQQPWIGAQTGIETASPRLMEKHMRGKVRPFKVKEWPEIVKNAFGVLQDSGWLPCGTLVLGLPDENSDDITDTIALIDDLYDYQSIIVPLFFVPINMSYQNKKEAFGLEEMTQNHWELVSKCLDHDYRWLILIYKKGYKYHNMALKFNINILGRLLFWLIRRKITQTRSFVEGDRLEGKECKIDF